MGTFRPGLVARAIGAVCVAGACGCPSTRDGGAAPAASTSAPQSAAPMLPIDPAPAAAVSVLAVATAAPVDERIVPLLAGQPLPLEVAPEGEAYGLELLFEVRQRETTPPPLHLGANVAAIVAAQSASAGHLRVTLGAGRARTRFGARTFAMEDGWELRADRRRAGSIVLFSQGGVPSYRVVPIGAMRPLLSERRLDVMALGPTHLAAVADPPGHLGRSVSRARVTTAWGSLVLDQIVAPTTPKPAANKGDARADVEVEQQGVDGAGEAFCRTLLELVAADRAVGGPPCAVGLVPVRAEITYTHGGGLLVDATSVREGPVSRAELAFPPTGARASSAPLLEPKLPLASVDSLLAIRTKGESTSLDLVDKSPAPRIALIDGVAAYLLPAGGDARVSLHAGRYVIEWRTPLGEIVERALELEAPGRATAAQWVPAPPSSASPMASARNGP